METDTVNINSNKYIATKDGKVYEKKGIGANALSIFGACSSAVVPYTVGAWLNTKAGEKYKINLTRILEHDNYYDKPLSSAIKHMCQEREIEFAQRGIGLIDYSEGVPLEAIIETLQPIADKRKAKVEKKAHRYTKHLDEMIKKYGGDEITMDGLVAAEEEWRNKYPREVKRCRKMLERSLENLEKNCEKYGRLQEPPLYEKLANKHPKLAKYLCLSLPESCALAIMDSVYKGENAFALNGKAHVNMENNFIALPHEHGHNLNSTSKGIFKLTNSMYGKPERLLLPAIFLTALFRRKKVEGEESKTIFGKVLDFVKNNCVILSAVCCTPKLIEEGVASIKGQNLMKDIMEHLPKENYKMLKKNNLIAFTTYLSIAVMKVGTVATVNAVRNWTSRPKEMSNVQNHCNINASDDTVTQDD